MRTPLLRFILSVLGLCCGAVQAQNSLPAPTAADLVPGRLAQAPDPGFTDERDEVSFAWPVDRSTALDAPRPFVHESREFLVTVDGAELRKGHAIDTTVPSAVIRISPGDGASALALERMEVRRNGRTLPGPEALERAATAEQLRQAGVPFPDGTLAFRVRPELGAGRLSLRAQGARGRYLIHVHEPDSPVRLYLGSERENHLAGGRLALSARLVDGGRGLAAERLGGLIAAPDGRSYPLEFRALGDGRALAEIELPAQSSFQPGLWEVHAFAAAERQGGRVLRDAKVAVAVAAPTARLTGDYEIRSEGGGLEVVFEVEVASGGRYEVGAVLYGSDADGRPQPLATGRCAARLPAGGGELTLRFGPELLGRGLTAPYELRHLTLSDQSRLGRLEYREFGPSALGPSEP